MYLRRYIYIYQIPGYVPNVGKNVKMNPMITNIENGGMKMYVAL